MRSVYSNVNTDGVKSLVDHQIYKEGTFAGERNELENRNSQ